MGESIQYVLVFVFDHALDGWKRHYSAKKITEANTSILLSWFMLPTAYDVMHNCFQ